MNKQPVYDLKSLWGELTLMFFILSCFDMISTILVVDNISVFEANMIFEPFMRDFNYFGFIIAYSLINLLLYFILTYLLAVTDEYVKDRIVFTKGLIYGVFIFVNMYLFSLIINNLALGLRYSTLF